MEQVGSILRSTEGVIHFMTDASGDTVTVTYESDITSAEKIGAALSSGGYRPEGPPRIIR